MEGTTEIAGIRNAIIPETTKTHNVLEQEFASKEPGITKTIEAFIQTTSGNEIPEARQYLKTRTFKDFQLIPILENADIKVGNFDFIPNDVSSKDLRTIWSSSTTGDQTKVVILEEEAKIRLPDEIVNTLRSCQKSILLHESRKALSHQVIDDAISNQVPDMKQDTYSDIDSFLSQTKDCDGVYLTVQVSAGRRLMRSLEQKLQENPDIFKDKAIPNFFLEVLAEPVDAEELDRWHDILSRAFHYEPNITVIYALTEQFVVGIATHKKGEPLKYKIKPDRFVEIVDDMGNPINEGQGQVVVTPLNKVAGSIFPRYNTTDISTLFVENGQAWLGDVSRNPVKGEINLMGYKINAQDMFNSLRKQFPGIPYQVKVVVTNDLHGRASICEVNILIENGTDEERSKAKSFMEDRFRDIKAYGFIWKAGNIGVVVNTSNLVPEDMTKGWKIAEYKKEMNPEEIADVLDGKYSLQDSLSS